MYSKVNIRVYKRGFKSTILIWNTDPLTERERGGVVVMVRRSDDEPWWIPQTAMPDVQRMGRVKDENTDTVAIVHDDKLDADTAFMVRLTFSAAVDAVPKEAFLKVEPSNQHKMFTKPERIVTEDGKTVYAENSHVISMDPMVIDKIARRVRDVLES